MKMYDASNRKQQLIDAGYEAGLVGQPIDSETYHGEQERAAWEIGWRSGNSERQRLARTQGNPQLERLEFIIENIEAALHAKTTEGTRENARISLRELAEMARKAVKQCN